MIQEAKFAVLGSLDRDTQLNILRGLFSYRETLIRTGAQLEERAMVETALGDLLFLRSKRSDINQALAECFMLGMVESRADALEFLIPALREEDEKIKDKVTGKEQVGGYPIVGVVGRISSGKGTVADILGQNYDSLHFVLSNQLRQHAMSNGLMPPFTREQLRSIDSELKPKFGKHVFVDWALRTGQRMARNLHRPQLITIDGFRSIEETQWFLNQQNTALIAVTASSDQALDSRIRYQRLLERNRAGEEELAFEMFQESDAIERSWIDPILPLAQHTFINDGSIENLTQQVKDYFTSIIPPNK